MHQIESKCIKLNQSTSSNWIKLHQIVSNYIKLNHTTSNCIRLQHIESNYIKEGRNWIENSFRKLIVPNTKSTRMIYKICRTLLWPGLSWEGRCDFSSFISQVYRCFDCVFFLNPLPKIFSKETVISFHLYEVKVTNTVVITRLSDNSLLRNMT